MAAPGRLLSLGATLLCMTPRIGPVESFSGYLPAATRTVSSFSKATIAVSSPAALRNVRRRPSKVETTQDGAADGRNKESGVQQVLSSSSMQTSFSEMAAGEQEDAKLKDDRELTLGNGRRRLR